MKNSYENISDIERNRISVIEAMDRNMPSFRAARNILIEINGKQVRLADLAYPFTA